MSPAVRKLLQDLERAKDRYAKQVGQFAISGPHGPVGMDVIDSLSAVILAQDEEISQLKSALQKAGIIAAPVASPRNSQMSQ